MNEGSERSKKFVTVSLLFGAMAFSYWIRLALGIVAPTLMKLYNISPKMMGYILSGWNWSYTGGLPAIGPLIDRLGPWIVMGVGSVVWGLSTLALPLAVGGVSLFAIRLIFGLGHAPLIPVTATSISRIYNVKERARAVAVAFAGNQVGLAAGAPIAAFIFHAMGWRAVFYWIGGASLIFSLLWFVLFPDKRIGRLQASQGGASPNAAKISWCSLFRYRATWGIALGQLGYLYAYFFFVSWLPGYLVLERKMTILKSGWVTSILFWGGLIGTLGGGWLADYLIKRGISITKCRKWIIGFGLTGSAIFVVIAAYTEQAWLAVTLLTLCVTSLRLATGSCNALPIDLAPLSTVGSLTSIQNFFGNIGGTLAPIVTGYIVQVTGSFVGALLVAGGMALFGAIAYVFILGNLETGRIQSPVSAAPTL